MVYVSTITLLLKVIIMDVNTMGSQSVHSIW